MPEPTLLFPTPESLEQQDRAFFGDGYVLLSVVAALIIGIGLVALAVVSVLACCARRKRKRARHIRTYSVAAIAANPPGQGFSECGNTPRNSLRHASYPAAPGTFQRDPSPRAHPTPQSSPPYGNTLQRSRLSGQRLSSSTFNNFRLSVQAYTFPRNFTSQNGASQGATPQGAPPHSSSPHNPHSVILNTTPNVTPNVISNPAHLSAPPYSQNTTTAAGNGESLSTPATIAEMHATPFLNETNGELPPLYTEVHETAEVRI